MGERPSDLADNLDEPDEESTEEGSEFHDVEGTDIINENFNTLLELVKANNIDDLSHLIDGQFKSALHMNPDQISAIVNTPTKPKDANRIFFRART